MALPGRLGTAAEEGGRPKGRTLGASDPRTLAARPCDGFFSIPTSQWPPPPFFVSW